VLRVALLTLDLADGVPAGLLKCGLNFVVVRIGEKALAQVVETAAQVVAGTVVAGLALRLGQRSARQWVVEVAKGPADGECVDSGVDVLHAAHVRRLPDIAPGRCRARFLPAPNFVGHVYNCFRGAKTSNKVSNISSDTKDRRI
jgi:hypothetical protein